MLHDSPPPVISQATYDKLLKIKRLARDVYDARTNFSLLCDALEKLYAHFDEECAENKGVA